MKKLLKLQHYLNEESLNKIKCINVDDIIYYFLKFKIKYLDTDKLMKLIVLCLYLYKKQAKVLFDIDIYKLIDKIEISDVHSVYVGEKKEAILESYFRITKNNLQSTKIILHVINDQQNILKHTQNQINNNTIQNDPNNGTHKNDPNNGTHKNDPNNGTHKNETDNDTTENNSDDDTTENDSDDDTHKNDPNNDTINDDSDNDTINNGSDNDTINNDPDGFDKILSENIKNNLIVFRKPKEQGQFSLVTFLKVCEKNNIDKKIIYVFPRIIVKKAYNHNKINKDRQTIIDNLGGINTLFMNEIKCLNLLLNVDHFPRILNVDYDNFSIYMDYCGKRMDKVPIDWKKQMNKIILSLDKHKIYPNDLWINNILIKNNKIYVIDFSFATFDIEGFPFINISLFDLQKADTFIKLLDNALLNSIDKRLKKY
jgi:hypothetical protein